MTKHQRSITALSSDVQTDNIHVHCMCTVENNNVQVRSTMSRHQLSIIVLGQWRMNRQSTHVCYLRC